MNIDQRTVTAGKSKTDAGTGCTVPLNNKATKVLTFWAEQFPDRQPEHCVFPSERYGAGGDAFNRVVFHVNPKKPIGPFKDSWDTARTAANVTVRLHDLRHTSVTRMLEGGAPAALDDFELGSSKRRRK